MTPKDERPERSIGLLEQSILVTELEAYFARTSEDARIANERLAMLKARRSAEARRLDESEPEND